MNSVRLIRDQNHRPNVGMTLIGPTLATFCEGKDGFVCSGRAIFLSPVLNHCAFKKTHTKTGGGHEHPLMLACLLGNPGVARCLVSFHTNLLDCWEDASPEAKWLVRRFLRKPLGFLEFGFGNPWVL